ncbi:MAG: metalloregulator ArsR/SmtB family transcription factor [Pseudomonadota bacterium]
MVKYSPGQLDSVFGALSDSTRRSILARLASGDALVTELAAPFAISLPAISKHLSVLEKAGLIRRDKHGRVRRCRLQAAPLQEAADWIAHYRQFWESRLDSLAEYLDTTHNPDHNNSEQEETHGRKRDDK